MIFIIIVTNYYFYLIDLTTIISFITITIAIIIKFVYFTINYIFFDWKMQFLPKMASFSSNL